MLSLPKELLLWDNIAKDDIILPGHKLGEAQLLFTKVEDEVIDAQLQRLENIIN